MRTVMKQHTAFRNVFPSVAHITEHALWRSAQATAENSDTAAAAGAAASMDSPRGMGLTERAWEAAEEIFAAVGCHAAPGKLQKRFSLQLAVTPSLGEALLKVRAHHDLIR
jgi:hypothetical protein